MAPNATVLKAELQVSDMDRRDTGEAVVRPAYRQRGVART